MVYRHLYSPHYSLEGYLNFTLSYFDPADFEGFPGSSGSGQGQMVKVVGRCRYYDFRHPPEAGAEAYEKTSAYWVVLAARLAFVVIFQNFVGLSVMAIRWMIPSVSRDLRDRIRRESYLTNEIIIKTELLKAKGLLKLDSAGRICNSTFSCHWDDDGQELDAKVQGGQGDQDGGLLHAADRVSLCRKRRSSTREREMVTTGDITDGQIVL